MSNASSRYDEIRTNATKMLDAVSKGKTRIVVQVGHTSLAVGAQEVVDAIKMHLPDNAYLVIAGDDGASFAVPQVIVESTSGARRRFTNVHPDLIGNIIAFAASDDTSSDGEDDYFRNQHRVTLDLCGEIDATEIDEYISRGGYEGLAKSLSMTPEDVIEQVQASGLRGRGGAYFPVALKWRGARNVDVHPRYLVLNCEEGEPGIFKDRHLMEGVPHRIIEGAIIAAYAAGVAQAYIYINAEANLSAERMQAAVDQAHENGLLGKDILGSGFDLEMEIRRGAGGYVCGEETTLLNTMEGYRREPRLRPPFPTESGLWSKPTVINNAETLASVPFIMSQGAEAYSAIGTDEHNGTKIVSLSGAVKRSGVAEVPLGSTIRQIIYDIGGGVAEGRTLTAIAVGGPSSGVFPVSMLDTPITPGAIHEAGVMLGAGGVIAIDESMSVLEVVRNLAAYNANESCGKCTPCREGTPRMVEFLDRLSDGDASTSDLDDLRSLAQMVNAASLCGLGQAAGNPILSALHFFGDELALLATTSQEGKA